MYPENGSLGVENGGRGTLGVAVLESFELDDLVELLFVSFGPEFFFLLLLLDLHFELLDDFIGVGIFGVFGDGGLEVCEELLVEGSVLSLELLAVLFVVGEFFCQRLGVGLDLGAAEGRDANAVLFGHGLCLL